MFVASTATSSTATSSVSLYARWNNPLSGLWPRVATSVAAWSIEGRTGAKLSFAGTQSGLDLQWMATTNLGYLDPRLWDNAGSLALTPWLSTTARHGDAVWRAGVGLTGGVVYQNLAPGGAPASQYHYRGFLRLTGETSVRTAIGRWGRFGARVFGGAFVGPSGPVRQLRIPIAGADPYETFPNPFLHSRGALLVRPGFYYHSPGGPNLRGFRNDLGGRWAIGVNLELTRAVMRRGAGLVREVALESFLDLGLADTVAVPSSSPDIQRREMAVGLGPAKGKDFATSMGPWLVTPEELPFDGERLDLEATVSVNGRTVTRAQPRGIVTQHRIKELAWTIRFEVPFAVNRWNLAADHPQGSTRFAFRWQLSFAPSF